MKKIVQKDTKAGSVLREIAPEVPIEKITSPEIQQLISDMFDSLRQEKDGVALAAPQIGASYRIFVVSPHLYKDEPESAELVYINPEIIKKSRDKKLMDEGCLSCRWWYGKIRRSSRATVRAYNQNGDQFEMAGTGLLAQIFQHETDHLDGVLFMDNAVDLKESPPDPKPETSSDVQSEPQK